MGQELQDGTTAHAIRKGIKNFFETFVDAAMDIDNRNKPESQNNRDNFAS